MRNALSWLNKHYEPVAYAFGAVLALAMAATLAVLAQR